MTDQNSQFFAILTAIGEAKQAYADALGVPWTFAHMGVGDANGTDPMPDRLQTRLINERRRAPLNQVKVDTANPNIIIAEQVIPPDVGGWWIREIGLYDSAGDLVAVANCAPSYKPLLAQGTGKTQVVRLNLVVTSTANVELKIDPAVVLATREYVDQAILSVLPPDKPAGTYTKVQINQRGLVVSGSNPTTLSGYGIITASQADAIAGVDNNKPMTALRVFQSIDAKVLQATETLPGVARLANQNEVDAGTDDQAMLTPKKLRWGFQTLLGQNGYIIFPSWLGGLVLQWGGIGFTTAGVKTFTYPIAFPNAPLRGLAVLGDSTIYAFSSRPFASISVDAGNQTSAEVQSTYATASSVTVFAIGF